jgi:hypothetical protein
MSKNRPETVSRSISTTHTTTCGRCWDGNSRTTTVSFSVSHTTTEIAGAGNDAGQLREKITADIPATEPATNADTMDKRRAPTRASNPPGATRTHGSGDPDFTDDPAVQREVWEMLHGWPQRSGGRP